MPSALVFAQSARVRTGEYLSCVKDAVNTREEVVIQAFSEFNSSMMTALEQRKDALADVWSETEKTERQSLRKTAWSNFKSAKKAAAKEYKSSKREAWKNYKETVVKECKSKTASVEEVEKTSVDASI